MMHWPQLMQLEIFRPLLNALLTLMLLAREVKSMAVTYWVSSQILTQRLHRTHLAGSLKTLVLELSGYWAFLFAKNFRSFTFISSASHCNSQLPFRSQ
jgi:hypothetical protein